MAEDNVTTMIQLLINDAGLDRYFHADVRPERKPLVISLAGASAQVTQLRKFDMPVKLTQEKSSGPVLSIRSRKLATGQTQLDFSYDVEGIVGRALFSDKSGQTVMDGISISER